MTTSTKRIIKVWLPSAIWLAIITLESTNIGSSDHTARLLYPIFAFLFGLDPARFVVWHALMRKSGHFVGYFILSVLLFRSWRATFPRLSTRWCLQWAAVAFLSTALVASLDEWHQSFLPSRTGTFRDVVLDSGAALVAQIVLFIFIAVKARKRTSRNHELPRRGVA
ncbi:MAG TPA: VanZ family protein [Terriglobales bacterium]|nr:VanZ family protein [Terriglobales bacterium]